MQVVPKYVEEYNVCERYSIVEAAEYTLVEAWDGAVVRQLDLDVDDVDGADVQLAWEAVGRGGAEVGVDAAS